MTEPFRSIDPWDYGFERALPGTFHVHGELIATPKAIVGAIGDSPRNASLRGMYGRYVWVFTPEDYEGRFMPFVILYRKRISPAHPSERSTYRWSVTSSMPKTQTLVFVDWLLEKVPGAQFDDRGYR